MHDFRTFNVVLHRGWKTADSVDALKFAASGVWIAFRPPPGLRGLLKRCTKHCRSRSGKKVLVPVGKDEDEGDDDGVGGAKGADVDYGGAPSKYQTESRWNRVTNSNTFWCIKVGDTDACASTFLQQNLM